MSKNSVITEAQTLCADQTDTQERKYKVKWSWAMYHGLIYLGACYGLYLAVTRAQWKTVFYTWFLFQSTMVGVFGGSHRLWSHRSFKAKQPLRILLMILQTMGIQNHIYYWATYHRVHHKYVDTHADPYNSRRGFFFSHVGWLLTPHREPEFLEKFAKMDYSDLDEDKIVTFQKKYYWSVLAPLIGIVIPTFIPWYFWGESLENSFFVASMLRSGLSNNATGFINSWAHMFGTRPYDKNICPTETLFVAVFTGGEGWHNYHHVFPWDYRAAEFTKYRSNLTTGFIDLMAKIGWAYDLKTVSEDMILKRIDRTGDGTRKTDKLIRENGHVGDYGKLHWGWGDKDMVKEDYECVKVFNSSKSD